MSDEPIDFAAERLKRDHEAQARKLLEEQRGKPMLLLDPETGLYSIVVDFVEVYTGLDPIGKREEVRRKAAVDHAREQGLRLVPPSDESP